MRISCNGCRVLRKGCSENCSIRPCLHWIKSTDAQANATIFLAKFYGRAGLLNLLNAGPDHLRPAIFRSLLYEACGRIVNPIYGSVGLLWSGSWQLCQAAVDAVLKGAPIAPITTDVADNGHSPPFKAYDIRHVSKDETSNAAAANNVRCRPKRTAAASASKTKPGKPTTAAAAGEEANRSRSHDSSLSQQSEMAVTTEGSGESKDAESMVSEETAEVSLRVAEIGLELTLGLESAVTRRNNVMPMKKRKVESCETCEGEDTCRIELRLDYE